MEIPIGYLLKLAILLQQQFLASAQDRSYYFTAPQTFRPQNGFINSQGFGKIPPTGFEHLDSYLAHPDLDTSDLSPHLRRTLPQYQVGFLDSPLNPLKFEVRPNPDFNPRPLSKPTPFSQQVSPSTHRPNYSHLFSKTSHNHNPQTETFLGQITIQSPADLPRSFQSRGSPNFGFQLTPPNPETYSSFSKFQNDDVFKIPQVVNQHLDATEKPILNNSIIQDAPRNDFLNHRTRIFAPESGSLVKSNDYFVNHNGDVFQRSTTAFPITTLNRKHFFTTSPTTTTSQPTRTVENTFNLDSLLEEPIRKRHPSSNDNVEVVEPVTLPPDKFYTIPVADATEPPETTLHYDVSQDFEYENGNTETTEIGRNDSQEPLYDVLTIKPSAMVKDDQFSKFVDSSEIDVTTETHNQSREVVSFVTTKSIINHTMVANETTPNPNATEQFELLRSTRGQLPSPNPTGDEETSTEGWVVVASVQTSRSVSGARYLPFPVVEQHERTKLLNEQPITTMPKLTTMSPIFENDTLPPFEKVNSSTESLIDKLDRVQSDLSSDVLTDGFNNGANHISVITEANMDKNEETTASSTTPKPAGSSYPPVVIRKFSPHARPTTTRPKFGFRPKSIPKQQELDKPQGDQPQVKDVEDPPSKQIENLLSKIKFKDNSEFLPRDYSDKKNSTESSTTTEATSDVFAKILKKATPVDISAILPSGYKATQLKDKQTVPSILKKSKADDVSAFLPPGYKASSTEDPPSAPQSDLISNILKNAKQNDISAFLPPGYKMSTTSKPSSTPKSIDTILSKSHTVDISAFLPPGYKSSTGATHQPKLDNTKLEDISALLPPGYKSHFPLPKASTTSTTTSPVPSSTTEAVSTTKSSGGFKVVFPSRPGGAATKKMNRLTTPKATEEEVVAPIFNLQPAIHKGWPSRATTEFTGWPTPSTTPISIEKLLEAARAAAATVSTTTTTTTASTTTVTTTSTTTMKPTTPGMCKSECDLAGTIKLTSGAKWVPELLDRNTREWQLLANEVQYQLEDVFTKSELLSKWYKKIRIDGFTKGSVLVDYVVELSNISKQINTRELKGLFNNALTDVMKTATNREAKASDLTKDPTIDGQLVLGSFTIDPSSTDFIVLPKRILPTVGYAEDNVFLPQWAIAIIVIGLASLLFVIIFGVTVLINKQKNAKKKQPSPLTEDMLNELNKNHMGGFDNYAADDLYNMDDVWNETPYDTKLPKKKSAGLVHDTSMPNIYDSWKSEWNGYYYNTYYGNNHHPSGSQVGYGRRRSDYDTNF